MSTTQRTDQVSNVIKFPKCTQCNHIGPDVREYEGGCGEPVCARCDRRMREETPEEPE
jgi:hypothetical protein